MLRLLTFSLVVGGIHFYLWARLVRAPQLSAPYRFWATAALVLLAGLLPATMLLGRRLPAEWARLLTWPAFIWLGLMFLLLVAVIATDLVRLAAVLGAHVTGARPFNGDRRTFLSRLLAASAGVGAAGLAFWSVKRALSALHVRGVDVELPRLPAASKGTTIVQLSDVHVGRTIGRAFIEEMVRKTNALEPDIIAITGDLVDGSVDELHDAVAPLARLRARHGVYFVTGNHEYYSGARQWMPALAALGIRVLRNERVAIGEGARGFDLAGIDDWSARGDGHGADLPAALTGRDPSRELVLLAHQPRAIEEAARHGVGLQLSGHTHGGQIWPFGYLVKLQQPYLEGLHRHREAQIYVNPGTGFWGPPMRLGSRAEITRIRLV